MMKIINRGELAAYAPVIRGLVAQENARGDSLSIERLQADLVQGNQYMLVFAKEEIDGVLFPLLVLLCQHGEDRLRGTSMLWVHNFFLADKVAFSTADWTQESASFDAMTRAYSKVQFMTDNPALLAFLHQLGYYAKATAIVCELTKEPGEGLTARGAALKLEEADHGGI